MNLRALTLLFIFALPAAASPATPSDVAFVAKKKSKPTERQRKLARVRDSLRRNLDGKTEGLVISWSFDSEFFTFVLDERRYKQHMITAAAITARTMFDLEGVPLPKTLRFYGRNGDLIEQGPFENVPKVVE